MSVHPLAYTEYNNHAHADKKMNLEVHAMYVCSKTTGTQNKVQKGTYIIHIISSIVHTSQQHCMNRIHGEGENTSRSVLMRILSLVDEAHSTKQCPCVCTKRYVLTHYRVWRNTQVAKHAGMQTTIIHSEQAAISIFLQSNELRTHALVWHVKKIPR